MPNDQTDMRKFAHDLRNMLGTLYNYVQLLEISLEKSKMKPEMEITQAMAELVTKMNALITTTLDNQSKSE